MNNRFKDLLRILEKINNFNSNLAYWLTILFMFCVTSLIILEVIFRTFGHSLSWSEELARWFLISLCFITSFLALQKGLHVGITFLVKKLPISMKKIAILISNILVFIFLIYVFYYEVYYKTKIVNLSSKK
jgi:TRAP-type C4-dicarboxylate transport system permease small subunit